MPTYLLYLNSASLPGKPPIVYGTSFLDTFSVSHVPLPTIIPFSQCVSPMYPISTARTGSSHRCTLSVRGRRSGSTFQKLHHVLFPTSVGQFYRRKSIWILSFEVSREPYEQGTKYVARWTTHQKTPISPMLEQKVYHLPVSPVCGKM